MKDCALEAHLRRSVEAALNVGVHCTVLEAGRPKVNDLDLACLPLEQNVLRLQVTVHNLSVAQDTQSLQDLQMHCWRLVQACTLATSQVQCRYGECCLCIYVELST